jgi:hypothetical protein
MPKLTIQVSLLIIRHQYPNKENNESTFRSEIMTRETACHADAFAVAMEEYGDRDKGNGEEAEKRARPTDTKLVVQRPSEKWERRAECGTH